MESDIKTILQEILDNQVYIKQKLDDYDRQTDTLLTAKQAARHLGVSPATFSRYKSRGLVKPISRDGEVGYLRQDLNKIKQ